MGMGGETEVGFYFVQHREFELDLRSMQRQLRQESAAHTLTFPSCLSEFSSRISEFRGLSLEFMCNLSAFLSSPPSQTHSPSSVQPNWNRNPRGQSQKTNFGPQPD